MDLLENKLVKFGLMLAVILFFMNMMSEQSVENLEEAEYGEMEEEIEVEADPASIDNMIKTESEPAAAPISSGEELNASDLLPQDSESAAFAERHPEGLGPLADKNFLTAGFHVGINTVGTSLRNGNTGFRSEPANPAGAPSPWNQTTITADINRRGFEIGCE